MRQEGERVAREAEDFALQNFPVQDVTLSYMGEFTAGPDLHEQLADDMPTLEAADLPDFLRGADGSLCPDKSWTEEQLFKFNLVFDDRRAVVRETLLKAVHDGLAQAGLSAEFDAVVVFMPYEWIGLGGAAAFDLARIVEGEIPDFAYPTIAMSLTRPDSDKSAVHTLGTVTHELGHVFGLSHIPAASDDAATADERCRMMWDNLNTRFDGIEGLRVDSDGSSALNKSAEEGNAEHPRALLPLMYPRGRPKDEQFISRDQYQFLLHSMGPMGSVPR